MSLVDLPQVTRFLDAVAQQDLGDLVRKLGFFQVAADTL